VSTEEALEVRTVDSAEGLETLRAHWEQFQHHPNADIDFFLTIIAARPEILHPLITVLYSDNEAVLLLAGRVEKVPVEIKIGYKVLLRPRLRRLTVVYGGLLGDLTPWRARRAVEALQNIMRRRRLDAVFLSSLRADGFLWSIAKRSPSVFLRDYVPEIQAHWQMTLPPTSADLVKVLAGDPKFQFRRLERYRRSLEKDRRGRIAVHCLRSLEDVPRICEVAERITEKTYLRELGAGFVNNQENQRRLELLAKKGLLRAFLLEAGGPVIAYWIGTRYGPVFYLDFTSYHPEYRKYNVGTLLFVEMAKSLCEEGVGRIDFGFGDAFYKHRFGDTSWNEASVYMFAPSLRGVVVNALRSVIGSMELVTRKALSALRLAGTVKKIWRRAFETSRKDEE
jgi:Acetyltransferase (GNAT) domain